MYGMYVVSNVTVVNKLGFMDHNFAFLSIMILCTLSNKALMHKAANACKETICI